MTIHMLQSEHTGLVIVDVQTKLMAVMRRREKVIDNIIRLLHLSRLFSLPVILTEQYPKMLGSTTSEVKEHLPSYSPIQKMVFNCCQSGRFNESLEAAGLTTVILMGVEAHICVFQTCVSLLEQGLRVHVPEDAVDSRTEENRRVGLDLMKEAGAIITSTETIIFQIVRMAGTREFKEMLRLIK